MKNKIPYTLIEFLANAEKDEDKRIEGIRDTIGLIDEWIKYFEIEADNLNPAGGKTIDLMGFIIHMRMGLKRFRGKDE